MNKKYFSLRLTPGALDLLEQLAQKLGTNQQIAVELAIRELATKYNIQPTVSDKENK
jgi:hypothetical protein